MRAPAPDARFDAFISYATDPDYRLARQVKRLLESFHQKVPRLPGGTSTRPLRVCLDGSDFDLTVARRRRREAAAAGAPQPGSEDPITRVIEEHLARADVLLVLCSANAARSAYVDQEIRWFARHRGADKVFVAVTEGADPAAVGVFPSALVEHGVGKEIFFDFRAWGGRRLPPAAKVRDFDDAVVNLASHLLGFTEGQLYPLWLREEHRRARRQAWSAGGIATVFLVLCVFLLVLYRRTEAQNRQLSADLHVTTSEMKQAEDAVEALDQALRGLDVLPTARARRRLVDALAPLHGLRAIATVSPTRINAVAFTPAGDRLYAVDERNRLVTLAFDSTRAWIGGGAPEVVELPTWDGELHQASGTNARMFAGATALRVTPDGRVVVAEADGQLHVVAPGAPHAVVGSVDHGAPVLSLAFAGERLYAGDDAGRVTVYRLAAAGLERVDGWAAHQGPVYAVDARDDWVVTGGGDGFARAWRGGAPVHEVKAEHRGPFYAVAVDPRASCAALGGDHAKVWLLDLETGAREQVGGRHPDEVLGVAFAPGGGLLAVQADNQVDLYDLPQARRVGTLAGHTRPKQERHFQQLSALAFAPHGSLVVTAGNDGRLFARDMPLHTFGPEFFAFTLPLLGHPLTERAGVLAQPSRLLGRCTDTELLLGEGPALRCVSPDASGLRTLYEGLADDPIAATATAPGDVVLVAHESGRVLVVDGKTGRVVRRVRADERPCCVAAFDRGGFVVASESGVVELWGPTGPDDAPPARTERAAEPVAGLAVGLEDDTVWLGAASGRTLLRLGPDDGAWRTSPLAHTYPVTHLTQVSEDMVMTGSSSGRVSFVRLGEGTEVHPEPGDHEYAITTLQHVPSLGVVVSADEKAMCVWDTEELARIGCVAPRDGLSGVALAPDGGSAYALEMQHLVRRVPIDWTAWRARAIAILDSDPAGSPAPTSTAGRDDP